MTHDGNSIIFSTGRRLYANGGYVGITEELDLGHGADGGLLDFDDVLTPAERAELSEHMIGLWRRYGEATS